MTTQSIINYISVYLIFFAFGFIVYKIMSSKLGNKIAKLFDKIADL